MSRATDHAPERLLAAEASDFERRILEAALRKQPSAASSARMARALGVSAAAATTAAAAATRVAEAATAKLTAATGATTIWPWVSVGVLGLVVAGAVVGPRLWRGTAAAPPPVIESVTAPQPPPPPVAPAQPSAVVEPAAGGGVSSRTRRAVPAGAELSEQIALVDAARAALRAGAGDRALEMLRRYQDKFPNGSFRPEATALKVEVLMKVGRAKEARALAARFVADHRGSLLAARVAEVAGLPE
jgi:hypothetical protein